jgi:hypothetical protein
VLVFVLTSQPLLRALASQLAKPALQAMLHWPATQVGVPLLALHACPQPPQFDTPLRSVSQPLTRLPSQFAQPESQVI